MTPSIFGGSYHLEEAQVHLLRTTNNLVPYTTVEFMLHMADFQDTTVNDNGDNSLACFVQVYCGFPKNDKY